MAVGGRRLVGRTQTVAAAAIAAPAFWGEGLFRVRASGLRCAFSDCEPYGRDWKRSLATPLLAALSRPVRPVVEAMRMLP